MESVNEYVKLSNSGKVNLTLPASKGYHLKVKAYKIETTGLKEFRGDMESSKLEGTTGNGGPQVEISTSQRVNLTFK